MSKKSTSREDSLPVSWRHGQRVGQFLRDSLRDGSPVCVTWLNHWSALRVDEQHLRQVDFVGVDGTFLQILLRVRGSWVGRSSADLVIPQFLAMEPEMTIGLIGGKPGVAEAARQRHPEMNVVLAVDGYEGVGELLGNLSESETELPDMLVIGMGAGAQERAALQLAEFGGSKIVFTAGGWIDQLASHEQYFPPLLHTLRLGWLWRIVHEPKRLLRRYTVDALYATIHAPALWKLFGHLRAIDDLGWKGDLSAK
ncbi:hypothetical protein GCM10009763_22320 [Dermacoccus profundi]